MLAIPRFTSMILHTPHRRDQDVPWNTILVTGLFLSNENIIEPVVDLLVLVLREASGDRK